MKIFALPSHQSKENTTGVDYARIIQPMKYLNGYKDTKVITYDIKRSMNWLYVAKHYDLIYFNYLNNPWGFAAMGAMARHYKVKIVMDVDDAIWEIHNDNPAYEVWKKGSEGIRDFTAICNEVDYITCTNQYLKNVIINNTKKSPDKVIVFPNYIDLDSYTYRSEFRNDGQINLTHFGSTTHFFDLKETEFERGISRIMKEYPNVKLRTVGAFIPEYREKWGARYENTFGDPDIYTWIKEKFPEFMKEADILVCPLIDDIYNRCKSQIKWLETSSAKVPGVYQKIRQYEEVVDGTNGICANKDTEWYRGIKYMIDNPDKRKKMGEKTFEDVKKWQIQNNLEDYYQFFLKVLDNGEKRV